MDCFARVRPFDPRRGFLCKRYVFKGFKFEAEKGWYKVSESLAADLKKCTQNPNAADPKPVFEIATKEEAEKIAREEYERENPVRKIQEAIAGAQTVPDLKSDTEVPEGKEDEIEEPTPVKPTKASKSSGTENPFGA